MTKAQEIYQNMKKRGRIYKAYGKWGISYASLYVSIKEAGYTADETIWTIIENMKAKGYIRESKDTWGRERRHQKYIITKWEN